MLIYSFITDYQAFNLRYKDNTTRDKNETKVGKQSANLGKNNEPIQNRLSFLIDCKSVILHHLTILSFPMVRTAWDNWWLLVDNEGKINFPVLGELKVGGLTKKEAEQLIVEKLKPYIKESPIVTVRMVNYKISVLGEVARPGTFTISNEKVNLLEALAMAGDMTVWGVRDNVKLIREGADGKQEIVTLDLNKAETILSPYYWLQQNDIVYVTPNKAKARNSDIGNSTSLWFSATSILVSLASLLVTIFK